MLKYRQKRTLILRKWKLVARPAITALSLYQIKYLKSMQAKQYPVKCKENRDEALVQKLWSNFKWQSCTLILYIFIGTLVTNKIEKVKFLMKIRILHRNRIRISLNINSCTNLWYVKFLRFSFNKWNFSNIVVCRFSLEYFSAKKLIYDWNEVW